MLSVDVRRSTSRGLLRFFVRGTKVGVDESDLHTDDK